MALQVIETSDDIAAIPSTILYDSGWKIASGRGVTTTFEEYTAPLISGAIVHIYASAVGSNPAAETSEWPVLRPYLTGSLSTSSWRDIYKPDVVPPPASFGASMYKLSINTTLTGPDSYRARDGISGIVLAAGEVIKMTVSNAALDADKLTYRFIAEELTSEYMVNIL